MAALATKAGVEGDRFVVHTPLQHLSKADIVLEAARLGLAAGLSCSCYDPAPGYRLCALCAISPLRATRFAEAGLSYAHPSELHSLMLLSFALFSFLTLFFSFLFL